MRFFLIFLILSSAQSSCIVTIVLRQQIPPQALSHGVIATLRHVLTTKIPILQYSQDTITVLPMPTSMANVTEEFIQENASNISKIQISDEVNLAMVELKTNILFSYPRNPAAMPKMEKLPEKMLELCYFSFNKLKSIADGFEVSTGLALDGCKAKEESSSDNKTMLVATMSSSDTKLCKIDNGLPMYCDHVIVGLLFVSNVTDCKSGSEFKYVPTYNKEAGEFIDQFITKVANGSVQRPNIDFK